MKESFCNKKEKCGDNCLLIISITIAQKKFLRKKIFQFYMCNTSVSDARNLEIQCNLSVNSMLQTRETSEFLFFFYNVGNEEQKMRYCF